MTADGVVEYDPANNVSHDGYAVFIYDKTGWDAITLYMWGDTNNLNGEWPGMLPTGTQKVNGVEYKYFDMGEANTGLSENLIFNNNGGGTQLNDYAYTIDHDVYLEVTTSGVTAIDPDTYDPSGTVTPDPDPTPAGKSYTLYFEDTTGWDGLYVYAWGDTEIFGTWPGAALTTTVSIGGRVFKSVTIEGRGETEHLIFHNNAGTQYDGPTITLDQDYYFRVSSTECTQIDPASLSGEYRIYIEDKTGWSALYLYGWGDVELFGGWPGEAPMGNTTIDGVNYCYWVVSGKGETVNLILNDNAGTQYDAATITIDKDYYFTASSTAMTSK